MKRFYKSLLVVNLYKYMYLVVVIGLVDMWENLCLASSNRVARLGVTCVESL